MKHLSYILIFFLIGCGTQKIADYKDEKVTVDDQAGDGGLDSIISPYRDSMDAQMQEVIGTATVTLEKGLPESPLGNFASEAAYLKGFDIGQNSRALGPKIMERSFALLNNGGLRAPINKGDIKLGDIYELMPFDNTLVLLKLSPDHVREMCDYLYKGNGQPIYNAEFILSKDDHQVIIGGKPYFFDEDVIVITSDYLASGGDKMNFLKDPILKYDSGIFLRDVFIEYVREYKKLGSYRITDKFKFF